ncbi:GlcNAc-PI de-N-acetylase [Ktedonobacter sp. SOSP1-52]|uniref:PIG-L deacetylase family protein n=1 Tax=Ktedonobacter sp. SOSP1-52 TaxID=2778366 RepID=UPI001915BBBE|nr:PIG-L family deacetylase [Ktedonobacter sp. SOSP1-52]GHO67634.1 GlcNAc-PI de-N-acetylase [Ktedonobacter sp. SOSP1-52]
MRLTSLNDIQTHHRHIFLSPHYDDVVYSCGGTLGVQLSSGLRPLVITVFGGAPTTGTLSPFAQQVHRQRGFGGTTTVQDIIEIRRKEDAKALDLFPTDYLWLDYQDAIYRGTPTYYNSDSQLMGSDVHPADAEIERQLLNGLLTLHNRLPDTVWYAPLGVGRHVDHQIVASVADSLAQHGAKVYFYEDFPYVTQSGALDARLKELDLPLEPTLVEMSEMLELRIEAAEAYATQTQQNFGGSEQMRQAMTHYTHNIRPVETIYLERYWTYRR